MDTFAKDRLPPRDQWPRLHFDLPELQYPARLNCATVLLDDAIAEGHGDRPAILTDAGAITYRDLLARANRIANVLTGAGVAPGNRVLLRGYNGPELYAAWLAVMKAGAIAVTTMPLLRAPELTAIIGKARPAFALCDHRLLAELDAVAAAGGVGTVIAWGNGDLESRMASASDRFANADTAADDVCLLAFTSGTTGQPKACMHFHRDVLAMADVVGRHLLETSPADVYAGSPPLGFTFGLGALLVFPLRFRAATVPIEAPSPANVLAAIEKHGVTCLFTAPIAYRALAGELAGRDLTSLKRCVSAGEFLPKAVSDLWFEKTGIRIIDGIGATEMIHIFISAAGEDIRPGSTGRPLPGYRACVLDEEGRELPRGSTGRLAVTGPTGCRYLDDPRQLDYVQERLERHRRPVSRGRRRLLLVRRARGRHDRLGRLQHRRARGGVGAARAPGGARVRRDRRGGRRARHGREGLHRPRARAGGGRGPRQGAAGLRQAAHRALQVPAHHRVPRGPAQDRHRQAPAEGAARP